MILMEGVCESQKGLLEYVRKSSPPPFLLKTYMLVEDPATDHMISWNADGSAFVVWQPAEFARDLLPTLFKHSNFSSFVRQLNTYGFRKVATSRWEFCNDKFRKGERDHLCEIRRRKAWSNKQHPINNIAAASVPTPHDQLFDDDDDDDDDEDHERSSSTCSSSEYSSLVDENKRLKQENGVLTSELTNMKGKCKELLDLVAKYTTTSDQHKTDQLKAEEEEEEEEEDERPKLFGVRLEVEGDHQRNRKRSKRSAQVSGSSASILLSQACK